MFIPPKTVVGDPFGVPDYLQLASFNRRSLTLDVRLTDGREGRKVVARGQRVALLGCAEERVERAHHRHAAHRRHLLVLRLLLLAGRAQRADDYMGHVASIYLLTSL